MNLTKIPLEALPETVHRIESGAPYEENAEYHQFFAVRRVLAGQAWAELVIAAASAYRGRQAEAAPIETIGAFVGTLDPNVAKQLAASFTAAPDTLFTIGDFAPGYYADTRAGMSAMNETNLYKEFTDKLRADVQPILRELAPTIERLCGHFWRVGSVRIFALKAGQDGGGLHTDGWPPGSKKLFLLPEGASKDIGTTEFHLRNGEILMPESGPCWFLFDNSTLPHRAVAPRGKASRPTIEFDLVPALSTDPTPFDAGTNGWFPFFPDFSDIEYARELRKAAKLAKGSVMARIGEWVRSKPWLRTGLRSQISG